MKILRTAGLKVFLPMDAPYFIKEHLWMGASDEATLIQYFFRCKDFSVRLFARFHFMNKNVYLAMLIFCSCRSRRYGREQLFCPIKIYSNTSDEMHKHYTFNSILFPCSWNVWVLCPPLPQEECKSIQVRVFSYWRLLNDKKTFRI